jgi:hypothetical protein
MISRSTQSMKVYNNNNNNNNNTFVLINVAIPVDRNVTQKEAEKSKIQELTCGT